MFVGLDPVSWVLGPGSWVLAAGCWLLDILAKFAWQSRKQEVVRSEMGIVYFRKAGSNGGCPQKVTQNEPKMPKKLNRAGRGSGTRGM